MAEENGAARAQLEAVRALALPRLLPAGGEARAAGASAWRAHGVQSIARARERVGGGGGGGEAAPSGDDVFVIVGLLRLPAVDTDFVFTLYAPLPAAGSGGGGGGGGLGGGDGGGEARAAAEAVFERAAATLEVADFGLFG